MPGAPQYPSVHPSIHLSIYLSISLQDPLIGGGRRHQGASPFYMMPSDFSFRRAIESQAETLPSRTWPVGGSHTRKWGRFPKARDPKTIGFPRKNDEKNANLGIIFWCLPPFHGEILKSSLWVCLIFLGYQKKNGGRLSSMFTIKSNLAMNFPNENGYKPIIFIIN